MTYNINNANIFLQLFSAGIHQKEADSNGILGYLEDDIKSELKRASKLVSMLYKLSIVIVGKLLIMNYLFSDLFLLQTQRGEHWMLSKIVQKIIPSSMCFAE